MISSPTFVQSIAAIASIAFLNRFPSHFPATSIVPVTPLRIFPPISAQSRLRIAFRAFSPSVNSPSVKFGRLSASPVIAFVIIGIRFPTIRSSADPISSFSGPEMSIPESKAIPKFFALSVILDIAPFMVFAILLYASPTTSASSPIAFKSSLNVSRFEEMARAAFPASTLENRSTIETPVLSA